MGGAGGSWRSSSLGRGCASPSPPVRLLLPIRGVIGQQGEPGALGYTGMSPNVSGLHFQALSAFSSSLR